MSGFYGVEDGAAFELQVTNCPSQDLAKTNCVFVSPTDPTSVIPYIQLGEYVFSVRPEEAVAPGCVGLNAAQRRIIKVSSGDKTVAIPFTPPASKFDIGVLNAEIDFVTKKPVRGPEIEIDAPTLSTHLLSRFATQIFAMNQEVAFEFQGTNYQLKINSIMAADSAADSDLAVHQGMLLPDTAFIFETKHGSGLKIAGQKAVLATQLFKHKEFNFEKLGIGGLDAQFEQIFRRAFASRIFPPAMVERLGIQHVKGVLLHGPPGTGKTLIARQIGKMLNGKEPKIVNGPEVLSKYVGASEENIRNLFKEAEADYQRMGDASDLHVIIFDEIDAICKQRGSVQSGSGVHDTVVNQLLTKIDGVDALNNILLIGMTNRKDMLDDALLRPGRLEVQVEIGLPDERGRLQILQIHTSRMTENSFLAKDVDLYELSQKTKNFSGAEIEGLVKSATSFALNRQVDVNDLSKPIDEENIKVTMVDFLAALDEVKPAFGATIDTLDSYRLHGVMDYGPRHQHLLSSCRTMVRQVQSSEVTPLITVLLEGPQGTGKTALAATVAIESGFPFVKVVSAEAMVGYSEAAKCQTITKIFDDAYKSPLSVIVLDEIERLLDYVAIGPRFSNTVLQTLLVLLKKAPPAGRRLFVIGTTSLGMVMEEMDVAQTFNVAMHVAALSSDEIKTVLAQLGAFSGQELEVAVQEIKDGTPIKKLLLLLDLARQGQGEEETAVPLARWTKASTSRFPQISKFVKRNFILRSLENHSNTKSSASYRSASSFSSSQADNSIMEDYNSRWETHWKTGPDGDGLKQGQMFDATKSSAALDALIASGSLGDLTEKRVFIPGCGRGYDLVTFVKAGAKEAIGLELAPSAVSVANEYVKSQLDSQSSKATVIQGDFFTYTPESEDQKFDIGFDYTFLCALMPEMRVDWGPSWYRIIRPGGLLITLIFPVDDDMERQGPPWPVNPEMYKELLKDSFVLRSLEKVPDEQSHPRRAGKEYMAVWERQA